MLRQCQEIAQALQFRSTLHGQITGLASSIFGDEEPILQGMLIRHQDEWATSVGTSIPRPLSFNFEDRAQQQQLENAWSAGVELMHEILTEIGAHQGWDSWVNHENYPVYKDRLVRLRENFLNRYAATEDERSQWVQAWPFGEKAHQPT